MSRRKLPQVGMFVRVVCKHSRTGAIGEVVYHLNGELKNWCMLKFSDNLVSCFTAKDLRHVNNNPLLLLGSQGE